MRSTLQSVACVQADSTAPSQTCRGPSSQGPFDSHQTAPAVRAEAGGAGWLQSSVLDAVEALVAGGAAHAGEALGGALQRAQGCQDVHRAVRAVVQEGLMSGTPAWDVLSQMAPSYASGQRANGKQVSKQGVKQVRSKEPAHSAWRPPTAWPSTGVLTQNAHGSRERLHDEHAGLSGIEGGSAAPEHVLAGKRIGLMRGKCSRAKRLHGCSLVYSIQCPRHSPRHGCAHHGTLSNRACGDLGV